MNKEQYKELIANLMRKESIMKDKIQEKIWQMTYGSIFGGMIVIGLAAMAKDKTVERLKKSMTLVKSKKS